MLRSLEYSKAAVALQRAIDWACVDELQTACSIDEAPWTREAAKSVINVFAHVAQLVGMVAFYSEKILGATGQLIVQRKEKQRDVLGVNLVVSQFFRALETHLKGWPACKASLEETACTLRSAVPVETLDKSMAFVRLRWAPHARAVCYERCSRALAAEVEVLSKSTPVWSHITNQTKYNSSLAKKQLMDHSMIARLDTSIHNVFELASDVCCLYEELGDGELSAENPAIAEAEAALAHGRTTVSILAAVALIEAVKLMKEKTLPEGLRQRLKKLAERPV